MLHCVMHVALCMQDDPFGAPFPLCESDFSGPDSRDSLVRWLAETQFDATLYCPECQTASPSPLPVEALPQAPQAAEVAPPVSTTLEVPAIPAGMDPDAECRAAFIFHECQQWCP